MQYKMQFKTMKKGGLTMAEYLLKMKSTIDALASVGNIISEEDQILHTPAVLVHIMMLLSSP